jgi:5'-nucleotidase
LKRKNPPDFPGMACFIARIVDRVRDEGLARGTFLNINAPHIPLDEVQGVKITRQASGNLSTLFEKRTDPRKRAYYWYGAAGKADEEPDTDVAALSHHYISVTPIKCDITDYQTMASLHPFTLE